VRSIFGFKGYVPHKPSNEEEQNARDNKHDSVENLGSFMQKGSLFQLGFKVLFFPKSHNVSI